MLIFVIRISNFKLARQRKFKLGRTVYAFCDCALMRNICLNWARAHEPSFQYSFGIPLFSL